MGVALPLAIAEFALRQYMPSDPRFLVWKPGIEQLFNPIEQVFPGVFGPSLFITNSEGMRADERLKSSQWQLLAFGGSATECLYLDQKETWSAYLQNLLSKSSHRNVWVGNIGQSGRSTRHNLQQIKFLRLQYPEIKDYIVLSGANDFLTRLKRSHDSGLLFGSNEFDRETLGHAFSNMPKDIRYKVYDPEGNYIKQSEIWSILRRAKDHLNQLPSEGTLTTQDEFGLGLIEARKRRQNARRFIMELPEIEQSIAEYEFNLKSMNELSKEIGIRITFMTQPSAWKEGTLSDSSELFWMGQSSEAEVYYSESTLNKGMKRYNEVMRKVAAENNVGLVDLAKELDSQTGIFYDDMHFNELGALLVAEKIYQYFKKQVN